MSDFTPARNYVVSSRAFVQASFGDINIGARPMNAVMIEFHTGVEYIYIGLPTALYNDLEAHCVAHAEGSDDSLGAFFNEHLFRRYRGARYND